MAKLNNGELADLADWEEKYIDPACANWHNWSHAHSHTQTLNLWTQLTQTQLCFQVKEENQSH